MTQLHRLIIMKVRDMQTEDDLRLAVAVWNEEHPDREIDYSVVYSTVDTNPFAPKVERQNT